jgi:drug/metabolite transporter (DMT)-like permease
MRKRIIFGTVIIILGLLISIGPQNIFKVCDTTCCCDELPQCHWSAQTEIGMGILIAVLGVCFIVFSNKKIQLVFCH